MVKCDDCGNDFYVGFIYKLKNGKQFCNDCLIKEGVIFTLKNIGKNSNEFFKNILTSEEYKRFLRNEDLHF